MSNGPFAYFDRFPGEGTPLNKGMASISKHAAAGKNAEDAVKLATDAGFSCQRQTRQQLVGVSGAEKAFEILESKLNDKVEYGYACRYKYGFWRDTWWIRFEVNSSDIILRLRLDLSE
jgi:hypothetical protein